MLGLFEPLSILSFNVYQKVHIRIPGISFELNFAIAVVWLYFLSPFLQIIGLLNVFTPQKSLEEFQDV